MGARAHVVEFWLIEAKRWWRSVLINGTLTPLFYVLALGVGLGTAVNRSGGSRQLGVPYLVFVAPALLVAAAVQIAASDATYPVLSKFKWERTLHGMAATPLSPVQISDGTLLWIALRAVGGSVVYLAVMSACGATQRWWAVLAIPAAALCAIALAAPVAAFAASRDNEGQGFNVINRFLLVPMFLFSGTFYPIDRLPEWARWLAYCTPLYHGTDLARAAAIGGRSNALIAVDIAYLVVLAAVGVVLSRRAFQNRIER